MTKPRAAALLLPLLLSGCVINLGSRTVDYEAATRPGGITGRLTVDAPDGRRIAVEGELLTARDDEILMLADDGIVRIPLSSLRRAEFAEPSIRFNGAPGEKLLERLRIHSRFPQRLEPEVLQRLLARYDQTEVREVGS